MRLPLLAHCVVRIRSQSLQSSGTDRVAPAIDDKRLVCSDVFQLYIQLRRSPLSASSYGANNAIDPVSTDMLLKRQLH
eukprot:scaffold2480_cov198-Chaetoceros_neogracile.AAC.6